MNRAQSGIRERPIRVLGIVTSFEFNGAIIQLHRCLREIDRSQIEFSLCCMIEKGPLYQRFHDLGVRIHVIPRRFRFDFSLLFRLAWFMRRGNFDVIYTLKHTSALWGRTAAAMAGVGPTVTHEKGYPLPFTGWLTTLVDRIQSRKSDLILANSEFTRSMVVERLGVSADRVRVLYNGLDEEGSDKGEDPGALDRVREIKRTRNVRLIGYIGRLSAEKGCDLFLRSLPAVFEENVDCEAVICGDGLLRDNLVSLALDLGLADRVSFVGWASDPVAVIGELEALVVPSLYESFCMLLLEAGLAEVPVVAADVGAISEINQAVGIAHLVPPRIPLSGNGRAWKPMAGDSRFTPRLHYGSLMAVDPHELAGVVNRLLAEPALCRELTGGARLRTRERFSLETHVRRFEAELTRVAQPGKSRTSVAGQS